MTHLERYTIKSAPTTDFLSTTVSTSTISIFEQHVYIDTILATMNLDHLKSQKYKVRDPKSGKRQTLRFQAEQFCLPAALFSVKQFEILEQVTFQDPSLSQTPQLCFFAFLKDNYVSQSHNWEAQNSRGSLLFILIRPFTGSRPRTSVTALTVAERGAWCSNARSPKNSPCEGGTRSFPGLLLLRFAFEAFLAIKMSCVFCLINPKP